MFTDITTHLVYQILNTPVREYPFPHFFNTNMFPEPFYAEIIKNMPDKNAYQTLNEQGVVPVPSGSEDKYERRSVITLHDDKIERIDKSIRDFWWELTKILTSPEFLTPLILKYQHWMIDEYGEDQNISYRSEVSLFQDIDMWDLSPHTDQQSEIVGVFFYLPSDDTTPYLGTSIYTPKKPGFTSEGGVRYPRENFNCANTLPFLPNSGASFYRCNTSFHGVEYVKDTGDIRNLIAIQILRN